MHRPGRLIAHACDDMRALAGQDQAPPGTGGAAVAAGHGAGHGRHPSTAAAAAAGVLGAVGRHQLVRGATSRPAASAAAAAAATRAAAGSA